MDNCDSDDTGCQTDCREDNPCGAQDPPKGNSTNATASASGTASATGSGKDVVYTGFGDGSASDGGPDDGAGARAAVEIGRVYGFGILAAGFIGGFAFLL